MEGQGPQAWSHEGHSLKNYIYSGVIRTQSVNQAMMENQTGKGLDVSCIGLGLHLDRGANLPADFKERWF